MDFSFYNSIWQAQNLPEGFSLNGGIISGSHNIKGYYSVPVTVTNDFGSDTKNITIIVRNRPGTEKFSILQNGVEIEQVTIPQLVSSIRDGSAQQKYNCTNTQLVIPVMTPPFKNTVLNFWKKRGINITPAAYYNVPLNFCSFRNVTLQNGSVKLGLILQFSKGLWHNSAPFDFPRKNNLNGFNRWRYSNLRKWLNSSGLNWEFIDPDDVLVLYEDVANIYSLDDFEDENGNEVGLPRYGENDIPGFIDFLPDDLVQAIQPIRIVTQVGWSNQYYGGDPFPEHWDMPDLIHNIDCDITYDKIFLPSIEEMGCLDIAAAYEYAPDSAPEPGFEGSVWEYYSHIINNNLMHSIGDNLMADLLPKDFFTNNIYSSIRTQIRNNKWQNMPFLLQGILSRSPDINSFDRIWGITYNGSVPPSTFSARNIQYQETAWDVHPAPAFVLC